MRHEFLVARCHMLTCRRESRKHAHAPASQGRACQTPKTGRAAASGVCITSATSWSQLYGCLHDVIGAECRRTSCKFGAATI